MQARRLRSPGAIFRAGSNTHQMWMRSGVRCGVVFLHRSRAAEVRQSDGASRQSAAGARGIAHSSARCPGTPLFEATASW